MNALHHIRSQAIGRANRLQRAARHFETLRPAFDQWSAGEIYVCKRTGTYRFRFGADSKSIVPWDSIAREVFPTPAAFAFAAMVLADPAPAPVQIASKQCKSAPPECTSARVNVIALVKRTEQEAA